MKLKNDAHPNIYPGNSDKVVRGLQCLYLWEQGGRLEISARQTGTRIRHTFNSKIMEKCIGNHLIIFSKNAWNFTDVKSFLHRSMISYILKGYHI